MQPLPKADNPLLACEAHIAISKKAAACKYYACISSVLAASILNLLEKENMETNITNGHSVRGRSFESVMQDLSKRIMDVKRPADFAAVLIYGVPLNATIRIGIEAGIFVHLVKAGGPQTAVQLAESIGKAIGDKSAKDQERRDFVVRNLRVLCAIGLVDETAPFTYHANEMTFAVADPGLSTGISQIYHGVMGPTSTMAQMVTYAKEVGWRAPDTPLDGPYQRAHQITGMSTFEHW